jgi:hypothetical protein
MPKNYGAGLDVASSRPRVLRDLVQLLRQDLWLRMDRNMVGVGREPGGAGVPLEGRGSSDVTRRD